MRLARLAGRVDVDAFLAELSSDQISEWMAFDRLHVSPERRGLAQLCAVVATMLGDGSRHYGEADFLPRRPSPEMDDGDIKAQILGLKPGG